MCTARGGGSANHRFSSRAQEPPVDDGWGLIGMRLSELRAGADQHSVSRSIIMQVRLATIFILVAVTAAPASLGQGPPPSYGINFLTVGAPGNAGASPDDFEYLAIHGIGPIGAVDHP